MKTKKTLKYIIYTPKFHKNIGGVIILHKLCHLLNEHGYKAYLYPFKEDEENFETCKDYNTPIATDGDLKDAIVIYPEIVKGNPLNANHVVRYLLNKPGVRGGDGIFGKDDMIVYYSNAFSYEGEQKGVYLEFLEFYENIFKDKESQRKGSAYVMRKGKGREIIHDLTDSEEITDSTPNEQLADLFNSKEIFYSYDDATCLSLQAAMCGTVSVVIPKSNKESKAWHRESLIRKFGIAYGFDEIEQAKSTLPYVHEYIDYIKEISELMLDEFVERTQQCAIHNISFEEYEEKYLSVDSALRQSIIQSSYYNLIYSKWMLIKAVQMGATEEELQPAINIFNQYAKELELKFDEDDTGNILKNFNLFDSLSFILFSLPEEEQIDIINLYLSTKCYSLKDKIHLLLYLLEERINELSKDSNSGKINIFSKVLNDEKYKIFKAEKLIECDYYNNAEKILSEIIEENQQNVDALNDLSVIKSLQNKHDEALELIKRVVEIDPENETALSNLNYLWEVKNNPEHPGNHSSNRLSIIIPVFNKKELTINCLRSLNKIETNTIFEVILIDNASTDGTEKAVSELIGNLKYEIIYHKNEVNLGFAKANNLGAKLAKYDNFLFLNNDTLADIDFITLPINYLQNPQIGIVGIKLLFEDGLVQHSGIAFSNYKRPNHIFKYFPANHPEVNKVRKMQAVTGACLFIKKELFLKVGGFDEFFFNGWEDMDLCFKIRSEGYDVLYTGEVYLYHLEGKSDGRLNYSKQNSDYFYHRWFDKIECDETSLFEHNKLSDSAFSFKNKYLLPERLNFCIKIGVPTREHKGWGDIYYAESLQRAFEKNGHFCKIHYLEEWDQPDDNIDVVIHIKGLSKYNLKKNNFNVIWIINHPELHEIEELNRYDLVLCASKIYYNSVKDQLNVPCFYLPQATDEVFECNNDSEKDKEIDILFVGNNYEFKNNRCRRIIDIIRKSGKNYDLHVIGKYWEGFIPDKNIKGDFVDWIELPKLYRKSKIVLNDHQETMRNYGFVNNRTYDVAISGSFQISDYVEGIEELNIKTFKNDSELINLLDYYLENEDEREEIAHKSKLLAAKHTFSERAKEIEKIIRTVAEESSPHQLCNICGYEGKDFLDMGERRKVRCPKCNSLERQRALKFLLERDNLIKPGMNILEIAPLNNLIFRDYFEKQGCNYVCIDKWKHGNPLDMRDTSWIDYEMDICDLKFDNNSFDLIIMQHVIEEVPDDRKAFSEIARVLKNNGFAILEIPHDKNSIKTIEFGKAEKYGNVRKYGVDVYERLSEFFQYREEIIIDGIQFSKLSKLEIKKKLNFPIILDHPQFEENSTVSRLENLILHLRKTGFTPITTAQAVNYIKGKVYYKKPVWITFDDGQRNDYVKSEAVLKKYGVPATSFLIPNRLSKTDIEAWLKTNKNGIIDIQNHSLNHRQYFIADNIIDIYSPDKYPNLFEKLNPGEPVFEFCSCLTSKRFIPSTEVMEEAKKFISENIGLDKSILIRNLNSFLKNKFNGNLGVFESDADYNERILTEIENGRNILEELFKKDIYAFSYPWGLHSNETKQIVENNHLISVGVNPQRINHEVKNKVLNRIDINGSAYKEFLNSIYTNRDKEIIDYSNSPTVAVLMTTYNRKSTLSEAIQSVISQTFNDWHLIIVNDGGEDVSKLVSSFNDPRIKYFNQEHKGKSAALNFAIKHSKSKYIAYLDDDDIYYPNHLETLISYLETHEESQFVYSIAREKEIIYSENGYETKSFIRYAYQVNSQMLRFRNYIPNLCAIHSRDLLKFSGLYDESLSVLIDWDLYRRLAIFAEPIFLNVETCEYRKKVYNIREEKQITGLYYRNPVKYYENRIYILSKTYPKDKKFVEAENAILLIVNDENKNDFSIFIEELNYIKNITDIQLIILLQCNLESDIIEEIISADNSGIMVLSDFNNTHFESFVDDVITSNNWEKIFLIDNKENLTNKNLINYKAYNERVINLSQYLNNKYKRLESSERKYDTEENLISIIIPTYNNWEYTSNCLKSIYENKDNQTRFEVIVVDNCSKDGTKENLKVLSDKYDHFKVILNDENLGFAKACNIGAENSAGNFILFLNNDIIVKGKWLDKMLGEFRKSDELGAVGAKLLYPDGTIQHAGIGIKYIDNTLVAYNLFQNERKDLIPANVYRKYQAVTAACLLIKKSVFNLIGGFDESFLNGYEDVDLCFRIQENGFSISYCPETEIIHFESKTEGRFNNVEENVKLLNEKWNGKIEADNMEELFIPSVSIIIPVFNQFEYTKACIESIRRFTHIPYEIIIIDDNSTDETSQAIQKEKDIRYYKNDENRGFPYSVNLGLLKALGKYCIVLNNDTVVTEGWVDKLVKYSNLHQNIGIIAPVTNYVSGPQLDKDANYDSIEKMHEYAAKVAIERENQLLEFPRVAFLCTLIKREVIEKIGGLDERFSPGNFEDDDFCLRAQLAGFKTIIAKDVFIHHFGSKSFKKDGSKAYNERIETNRKIFVDKWGSDPEGIWLRNEEIKNRNIYYPINGNLYKQSLLRAIIHSDEEDYSLALQEYLTAIDSFDKYPHQDFDSITLIDLLKLAGNIAINLRKFELSEELFQKMTEYDKVAGYFWLGETYYNSNLRNKAIKCYEKVLEISPTHEPSKLRITELANDFDFSQEIVEAENLIQEEKYPEAALVLNKILEVNPENVDALNNLAVLNILTKNFEEALNILEKVFQLSPNNEIARSNLEYLENTFTS